MTSSCPPIALLLPHSEMPLNQITTTVSGRLSRHVTGYQMGKLTAGPEALRILTELAFAIDAHDIPIDYRRRRDLAAASTLIDDATWTRMIREAGMRPVRAGHARRYLYELLTGCSLRTAPPPCQLTSAGSQARYNDFIIGMPASLVTALAGHARRLLGTWGIEDEPPQWQPPTGWVAPPPGRAQTPRSPTPPPIHHALLHEHLSPAHIAGDLGISIDHLRQVLRRHPLPRPPAAHPLHPHPRSRAGQPAPRQQPGLLYLDPDWLRDEYLTWHRSLDAIAAQTGCPIQTLNRFAHQHAFPSAPAAAAFTSLPPPPPVSTRATCPSHSAAPSSGAAHGDAWTTCWSSPSTPASTRPPRRSADGPACSVHSSTGQNAPAADPLSTAAPALRAPQS